jgi:hypothetical protein
MVPVGRNHENGGCGWGTIIQSLHAQSSRHLWFGVDEVRPAIMTLSHALCFVLALALKSYWLFQQLLQTFSPPLLPKEWPKKTQIISILVHFLEIFVWKFLEKRWMIIWADLIPMFYMSLLIITLKTATRGTVCRAAPKL